MDTIRKILVPTDFSAHADEAFRVAQTLAHGMQAEITLFHVAHAPAVVVEGGGFLANPGTGAEVNLWQRLHAMQPADAALPVKHEVIVADRSSAAHIVDLVDNQGCDLIVMGTHGRSWLRDRLFGSVTQEVVRRAHCPVVVVKAPVEAAAVEAAAVGRETAAEHPSPLQ